MPPYFIFGFKGAFIFSFEKRGRMNFFIFKVNYASLTTILSSFKAFEKETIVNTITIANGKAAAIDAVCNTFNPPASINAKASADCIIPQIILVCTSGFRFPCLLSRLFLSNFIHLRADTCTCHHRADLRP